MGESNFVFEILEAINDFSHLDKAEKRWLDLTKDHTYNIQDDPGFNAFGTKRSDYTKTRIGQANSRRVWSEESKKRMSDAQRERFTNNPITEDERKRRSDSHIGLKHSAETKAKIGLAHSGKTLTELTKSKLRIPRLGISPTPEAHQQKLSACRKIKPRTSTKYKGVSLHRGAWRARFVANARHYYLGRFKSESEAAENVDFYMIKIFGREGTYLNFPEKDYSNFEPKRKILIP